MNQDENIRFEITRQGETVLLLSGTLKSKFNISDVVTVFLFDSDSTDLSFFQKGNFQQLEIMNLPLKKLDGLQRINIRNLTILNGKLLKDFSSLAGKSLNSLTLMNLTVSDIDFLSSVETEYLSLAQSLSLYDISGLSKMKKLKILKLDDTSVRNITPLCKNENLIFLSLANTPVENLEPLVGLSHLETLIITGTPASKRNIPFALKKAIENGLGK